MTFFDIFSKEPIEKKIKVKIEVDNREKSSLLPSELIKIGFNVEFKQLEIGDYIINETAIERKTITDLKKSIIDKRIFSQLKNLKQFEKYFLIIEGNFLDLFNNQYLNSNAVRGLLLYLAREKVPLIYSFNETDTAKYIELISRRTKTLNVSRPFKITSSLEDKIQFIIEGFPGIGPIRAKKLINKFKSIKNIINADPKELSFILGNKTLDFLHIINHPN
jgi:ERCC4-type nuclease